MRFLTDQDVYHLTTEFLRALGHDVITAREVGLAQASDLDLLTYCRQQRRLLATRDTDFGALIFASEEPSSGVILLRVNPATVDQVHQELARFLDEHSEQDLATSFVVVEPGRHRLRKLTQR